MNIYYVVNLKLLFVTVFLENEINCVENRFYKPITNSSWQTGKMDLFGI